MIAIDMQYFGGNGAASGKSGGGGANYKEVDDDSIFDRSVDKWRSDTTLEERDAVRDYTGLQYVDINDSIRNNPNYPDAWDSRVSDIDTALNKFNLKESIITYRGLGNGAIDAMIPGADTMSVSELNANFKGAVISDPAFLSTSITRSTAQDFATTRGTNNYVLRINVPKGKGRGAYVKRLSNHPYEDEFLMPRNTKLKISKVTRVSGDWGETLTLFHADIVK